MLFAMSQFEELYRELFEGASTLDALRLTQGLDNLTMKGDRWLWRLEPPGPGHAGGVPDHFRDTRQSGDGRPGKKPCQPAVPG